MTSLYVTSYMPANPVHRAAKKVIINLVAEELGTVATFLVRA